jgi:hypothetical protein
MNKSETHVLSRSRRILGDLENFVSAPQAISLLDEIRGGNSGVVIDGKGMFCGVYHNDPEIVNQDIVVTSRGLYVISGTDARFIDYVGISSIGRLPEKGSFGQQLSLVLRAEGLTITLYVTGGVGRFRDIYEFGRFLMRACDL